MSPDPKSRATMALASIQANQKTSSYSSPNPRNNGKETRPEPSHNPYEFKSMDDFVAGLTAAMINTSALFPINKLIFRQMAGGHRTQVAADQLKQEGIRYLYRGILPPLIQKMCSISIMFGTFGPYKRLADRNLVDYPEVVKLVLAALLTGNTEAILTPLERVQVLLQDRKFHGDYKNTKDALLKLKNFGYFEYYRGLTCVLLRNGPSNVLFFGLREELTKFMPDWGADKPHQSTISAGTPSNLKALQASDKAPSPIRSNVLHNFLSGAILGAVISTLFYPLSVVRTRMQTRPPGTEFLSIVKAFNAVYNERDRKISRLFQGCTINVLRQFVSWGIINCSYEYILELLQSRH